MDIVQEIDSEIGKRSLLKHSFYRMWSEGKLRIDHLQGYSKEYFQLVRAIPGLIENITADGQSTKDIVNNAREEAEHIEQWVRFASALGISKDELLGYNGTAKTREAVAAMQNLSESSFEEAAAAMYALEAELPKISRSKLDGLKNYYGLDSEDATRYFRLHEEADVRHAQAWREILKRIPSERHHTAFIAAVESLKAQNMLLDSVHEKYVGICC